MTTGYDLHAIPAHVPAADPTLVERPAGLQIRLRSGVGAAPTALAAFDAALLEAGIANFNLIRLSSVIPAASHVIDLDGVSDDQVRSTRTWGDRLYVVMADMVSAIPGADAWAGIGWVRAADGRGLFVEHCGTSEEIVRDDIVASLGALVDGRGESFSEPRMKIRGASCRDQPVCALVAAAYRSDGWS
jgi:arginine decarboxylase